MEEKKRIGVVRRFDDLGRIVIPKEYRKAIFGVTDVAGYPMDITLTEDNELILSAYRAKNTWEPIVNPFGELTEFICNCGCSSQAASKYCPDCGVAMDNEDIEERIKRAIAEQIG